MKTLAELFRAVRGRFYYYCCPDKIYLNNKFKQVFGRDIDWKNPTTFNEKLQWLKIYDRNPLYTKLVDKYEVRKYVAEKIGEEYLIPCLGVWNKVEDIDFDKLPNQFVLKCTHDSHSIVICKDKCTFDVEGAKRSLKTHLKRNFYYNAREWPYKHVKPRIIAEKYMFDESESQEKVINDYKLFCFDGQAKCLKIDFDRFTEHHANYYDMQGKLLKIGEKVCPPDLDRAVNLPDDFQIMKSLSEVLAQKHVFLRTDFYDVNGKIYFGELTFYPSAGFGQFIFDDNDELLGKWIKLPEKWGGILTLIDDLIIRFVPYNKDIKNDALIDYKYFCFNGKPSFMYISNDAGEDPRTDFFDMQYRRLPFHMKDPASDEIPEKPKQFEKMAALARIMSEGIPHVRVDFYCISGKIYFGEMTFFHCSGFAKIEPLEWDRKIGNRIIIS